MTFGLHCCCASLGCHRDCVGLQAAAQEAQWAKQIAASDSKADNAEGMAAAMNVSVKQLEAQLQQQQQTMATKDGAAQAQLQRAGMSQWKTTRAVLCFSVPRYCFSRLTCRQPSQPAKFGEGYACYSCEYRKYKLTGCDGSGDHTSNCGVLGDHPYPMVLVFGVCLTTQLMLSS